MASVHTFSTIWVFAPVVPGISLFLVCVESKVCVTVCKGLVCVRYTQYTYGVVFDTSYIYFVHISGICTQSNTVSNVDKNIFKQKN
mgnify:FL=1